MNNYAGSRRSSAKRWDANSRLRNADTSVCPSRPLEWTDWNFIPNDVKTKDKKDPQNPMEKKKETAPQVWINPNSTFRGPRGNRAWDHPVPVPTTSARLLELANVALGLTDFPAAARKKKRTAA